MPYVPLHVHSDFSFLDGYSSPARHVERAASLGYTACGLTDHGEVSGHLRLQKAAKQHGIKPIYGMEGYYHPGAKRAAELKLRKSEFSHITLLAESQRGLSNLWRWSTRGYVQQRDGRPIVDWDDMKELSEGIWASDGCMMGHLAQAVIAGDDQAQHELMGRYLDTFGDHFFIELHTWQFLEPNGEDQLRLNEHMTMINQAKVDLARQYGVPLTVVNDCHYASPEEWKKHSYVWNMNTKPNPDQTPEGQKADWLMEEGEIVHFMARHGISEAVVAEAIANTQMIADRCDVEIKGGDHMPSATGSADTDREMFYRLLGEGLQKKVIDRGLPEGPYLERLNYEVPILTERHFDGYFDVKADLVRWAKYEADILVGPGRGSAGGSLCAYLMDITEVDPIPYDLLFERFINPEREDYPDIDTDFQQSRLKDVKKYLAGKYGEDHVCSVGTVATAKPKSMVVDLARGMKLGYDDYMAIKNDVAKLPDGIKWQELVENPRMEKWQDRFPDLFQEASEMLGMNRQVGTHASAFLISSDPLDGNLPMRIKKESEGAAKGEVEFVSQFDGDEVAELGYVKIDLLGNRNNDTLYDARKMIQERHGRFLDYYNFGDEEYTDPSIWVDVAKGDSLGLFQLEANLMQGTAARFKPQSEREVAELLAINRPGVIDAKKLDPYIDRKHGREEVDYDHPMMEEIVGESYGILIYQEQLMKMAKLIAGFTPGEAEWLRKVVGKKKVEALPALKKQFYDGCLANDEFTSQCQGDPRKTVDKLWSSIEASGLYSFNKCAYAGTLVHLGNGNSTMTIEDMWRRLYDLADPGTATPGEPCRFGCDKPAAPKGRGQCKSCVAWRNKFRSRHPKAGLYAMSLCDDGRIRPRRIKDVHRNGVLPGLRITLENGRSITATGNHRHMTPNGWKMAAELSVGDELVCMGEYEPHRYESGMWNTTTIEPSYASAKLPTGDRNGENSLGYRDGGFVRLQEWTATQEWKCSAPGCTKSKEAGDRIERSHQDGDRTNNDPSNLRMLCVSHHKAHDYQVNGRRRRYEKGIPTVSSRIVEVARVEPEMTYDLEMEGPEHNWVGEGVVTHNSHSVAYALTGSWQAYTRQHYYPEYVTALMMTDPENIPKYVRHARKRGLEILPPDINTSGRHFTLTDEGIRYGLTAVRSVKDNAYNEIEAHRPFASLEDLLDRTAKSKVNKAVVLNLIHIGAFDSIDPDRVKLEQRYYEVMKVKPKDQKPIPDYSNTIEMYRMEMHLVGSGLMYDPCKGYEDMIDDLCIQSTDAIEEADKGDVMMIGGLITKVRQITTKKGDAMAFMGVTYKGQEYDIAVFPEAWQANKVFLEMDAPLVCRVSKTDRGVHLLQAVRLDMMEED